MNLKRNIRSKPHHGFGTHGLYTTMNGHGITIHAQPEPQGARVAIAVVVLVVVVVVVVVVVITENND